MREATYKATRRAERRFKARLAFVASMPVNWPGPWHGWPTWEIPIDLPDYEMPPEPYWNPDF